MVYSLLTDREANFEAMRRFQNQKEKQKHTTIKCKNCNAMIEILKPEDQYLQCPKCFKRYFLSYSIANSKLYGDKL